MKTLNYILLSGAFLLAGLVFAPLWTLGALLASAGAVWMFVEDTARLP